MIRDEIVEEVREKCRANNIDHIWQTVPYSDNYHAYIMWQNFIIIIVSFPPTGICVFFDPNMKKLNTSAYAANPSIERLFPYEDPASIENAIELITSLFIGPEIIEGEFNQARSETNRTC